MQICLHTRLTTHELFLSLSLCLSLFHTHTQGSNTHVQAPMPANESFFTNVMPLPHRLKVPLWVGQEPERSSGAPLVSPEKVHPPKDTLQGAASAELKQRAMINSSLIINFLFHLSAPPFLLARPRVRAVPRSAIAFPWAGKRS